MKESRLKELCLAHLSDKKTYKRLKKDPTNDIRLLVNRTLQEVLSRSEVPESVIDALSPTRQPQEHSGSMPCQKPTRNNSKSVQLSRLVEEYLTDLVGFCRSC